MMFSANAAASVRPEHEEAALSILLNQHYRYTRGLFDQLEQEGIFLGNGSFAVAVMQNGGPVMPEAKQLELSRQLEPLCRGQLSTPVYYVLPSNGTLHFILCYPRADASSETHDRIKTQLFRDFTAIVSALVQTEPNISVLISDVFHGEAELFLAANSLHHAMEYYVFREKSSRVTVMDTEQMLHGAFVEDFGAYRKLSNQIAQELTDEKAELSEIADRVVDVLLENSAPSMESVHHHIQMFALTFTEHLSTGGIVDAVYMQQHRIVRRCMAFETERDLRETMKTLLGELRQQYRTLKAVGNRTRMQQVRDYVDGRISDPQLSVNQLAEQFSASPSQLTGQFKRYYAQSLHQYIQNRRLELAKALMDAHPDWSMAAVSRAAGYTDISTMYRVFKKVDGVSPATRKQQHKKKLPPDEIAESGSPM